MFSNGTETDPKCYTMQAFPITPKFLIMGWRVPSKFTKCNSLSMSTSQTTSLLFYKTDLTVTLSSQWWPWEKRCSLPCFTPTVSHTETGHSRTMEWGHHAGLSIGGFWRYRAMQSPSWNSLPVQSAYWGENPEEMNLNSTQNKRRTNSKCPGWKALQI